MVVCEDSLGGVREFKAKDIVSDTSRDLEMCGKHAILTSNLKNVTEHTHMARFSAIFAHNRSHRLSGEPVKCLLASKTNNKNTEKRKIYRRARYSVFMGHGVGSLYSLLFGLKGCTQ